VNERSSQSPNISQKSILLKQKSQCVVQEKRKYSIYYSDDGGERKNPKGDLERPQKILVTSKRKRGTNKEGESEDIPEEKIVLEDMDLDVNIENIEFLDEEQRI
jgi:hypothetical protein